MSAVEVARLRRLAKQTPDRELAKSYLELAARVEDDDEATKDQVQITELVSISPSRIDGVRSPANGFPILMMKSSSRPAAVVDAARKASATSVEVGRLRRIANETGDPGIRRAYLELATETERGRR